MKFVTNYGEAVEAESIEEAVRTYMEYSNATRAYHGLDPVYLEGYIVSGDSAKLITDWGTITIKKED